MLGAMQDRSRSNSKIYWLFLGAAAIFVAALLCFFSASPKNREEKKLVGMIVPHHDLVSPLIDDMFAQASSARTPKTILLIGPNHFDRGNGFAITSLSDFDTSFGTLKNNPDLAQTLLKKDLALEDTSAIVADHSIMALVPFVKKYFPDATFVPLILHSNHKEERSRLLGKKIGELLLEEDILVIGSIDFSHYLSSEIAPDKDAETRRFIQDRDYISIAKLGSDHLDSAPTLVTLLTALESFGSVEDVLVHHTNSGEYIGKVLDSSTSYLTYLFWKK